MSDTVTTGQIVNVHYVGTFDSGEEFDNSRSRDALEFQVGGDQMIAGFDAALVGMTVGETKNITLAPQDGYGPSLDQLVQTVPKAQFPEGFVFDAGGVVQGENDEGQPVFATICEAMEDVVTLDFNHPLAGKNLNFEIELISVQSV